MNKFFLSAIECYLQTSILDDGSLVISGVTSSHLGTWRCRASNLVGTDFSDVTLQVKTLTVSCNFQS